MRPKVGKDRVCIRCMIRWYKLVSIYSGVSRIYTPPLSPSPLHLYLRTPPSPSPSPSLYLRTPAVAQSSAKLSGGGGEKRISPPQRTCCWHGIWPDSLCGVRPKAAGMRPVACGPHGPPPAPCRGVGLTSSVMLGIGLRMWYSASPSMPASFPYIFACLSLSLLSRQSLLYDSQFNISIRSRLISTHASACTYMRAEQSIWNFWLTPRTN